MKIITLLLSLLLLAGCSGDGSPDTPKESPPTFVLLGDSRCVDNELIPERDCVGGRALLDIEDLPRKDIVVIHLAINDMIFDSTPAAEFGAHLEMLVNGSGSDVWCVMPTYFNPWFEASYITAYRERIASICDFTIDPNIQPLHPDSIHYNQHNYQQVSAYYSSIKESYAR